MQKFFNFVKNDENEEVELYINGDIVDDDSPELYEAFGVKCVAPTGFKEQLKNCEGKNICVYIDSYGGDVAVASSIYTMLREYKGNVTVKIDSIAASAASVIAMAGDKVLMSPTAFMMIHDPATLIWGNITEVKQGYEMLKSVKEGIINAYERKCGDKATREKIAKLMTDETWLDYNAALKYGFVDGEIGTPRASIPQEVLNSLRNQRMVIYNKVKPQNKDVKTPQTPKSKGIEETDAEDKEAVKRRNINIYKAILLNKNR